MNFIYQPWPWYVSGPLFTLIMLILLFSGKSFGVSGNLRTLCTICGAGKHHEFFRFDWKEQQWNLLLIGGTAIGGFLASHFLTDNHAVLINESSITSLNNLGFQSAGKAYAPLELYDFNQISSYKSILLLVIGGLLVGFGARYAGGCTSGHAITGLSEFQLPSLIAVVGFFIGGLTMIHLIFPFIF